MEQCSGEIGLATNSCSHVLGMTCLVFSLKCLTNCLNLIKSINGTEQEGEALNTESEGFSRS